MLNNQLTTATVTVHKIAAFKTSIILLLRLDTSSVKSQLKLANRLETHINNALNPFIKHMSCDSQGS